MFTFVCNLPGLLEAKPNPPYRFPLPLLRPDYR